MSAFSFTAPYVSEKEERVEREALTEEERELIKSDLFGTDVEVKETAEVLQQGLAMFHQAVRQIPSEEKFDYLEAVQRVPHLVERESNAIALLRCQKFDAWAAASRLVAYWKLRKSTFGANRAFLPMALEGAMAEDLDAFRTGVVQILPNDEMGRAVLFFNRILAVRSVITRDALGRCFFYLAQVLFENEDVQNRGYVLVINVKGYDLHLHYDRIMIKKVVGIISNGPVRWRVTHFCTGSGRSGLSIMLPVLKYIVGRDYRLRFVVHEGSDIELLHQVSDYGLVKEHMSHCLGGSYGRDDFLQWVRERQEQEIARE